MKLTYDPKRNIAYMRLHEKKAQAETIRASDALNVDVSIKPSEEMEGEFDRMTGLSGCN